jgi:hypothetical protein
MDPMIDWYYYKWVCIQKMRSSIVDRYMYDTCKMSTRVVDRVWKLFLSAFSRDVISPSKTLSWIEEMYPLLKKETNIRRVYYDMVRYIRMRGWKEMCATSMYSAILLYSNILNSVEEAYLNHLGSNEVVQRGKRLAKICDFCLRLFHDLHYNGPPRG